MITLTIPVVSLSNRQTNNPAKKKRQKLFKVAAGMRNTNSKSTAWCELAVKKSLIFLSLCLYRLGLRKTVRRDVIQKRKNNVGIFSQNMYCSDPFLSPHLSYGSSD